jgi:hypothetical protein
MPKIGSHLQYFGKNKTKKELNGCGTEITGKESIWSLTSGLLFS